MLGADQVFQAVLAEVTQTDARRQTVAHQFARRRRQQDLPAVPGREQARDAIEQRPDVVIAALLDGAGVQRHAHADLPDRPPRLTR